MPPPRRIESLRKVVLNPLNHARASSITRAEVDAAIKAVEGYLSPRIQAPKISDERCGIYLCQPCDPEDNVFSR